MKEACVVGKRTFRGAVDSLIWLWGSPCKSYIGSFHGFTPVLQAPVYIGKAILKLLRCLWHAHVHSPQHPSPTQPNRVWTT